MITDLVQIDDEGRHSRRDGFEVVQPGEDLVDEANLGRFSRYKAANMCEIDDQRYL